MVTKRKPPKQNNVEGAPAKPARPSVKGKPVARSAERPKTAAKPGDASGAKPTDAVAGVAASKAADGKAQGAAAPSVAGKPKRRIAMPQSSTRLKRNRAANGAAASAPDGEGAAAPTGERPASAKAASHAGKPTKARKPLSVAGKADAPGGAGSASDADRDGAASGPGDQAASKGVMRSKLGNLKRFSVAKADKKASDQAKDLDGKVSADDAAQAEDAARSAIAAEAAKRRLERRQRMMKRAEGEPVSAVSGSEASGGADAEGKGARPEAGKRARKAPAARLSWPIVAVLAVLAILVVCVGVFSWGRWLRYDDAADFQGLWYANGTTSVVTVDGQKINLTDDVAYDYSLDTGAKTITFTFGNLQGQGRYRFSVDRSELVIADGKGFSFWGNLFDDIGWQLDQAIRSLQGQEIQREAAVDGVTVLDRTPTQGATAGQAANAEPASGDAAGGERGDEAGGADGASADDGQGDAADPSAGTSDGETVEDDASSAGDGSSSSGFTGAVAEGGIDSAGSNAVTLEQLKSGSLQ